MDYLGKAMLLFFSFVAVVALSIATVGSFKKELQLELLEQNIEHLPYGKRYRYEKLHTLWTKLNFLEKNLEHFPDSIQAEYQKLKQSNFFN